MIVVLGVVSGLVYGASDFLAGIAARRVPSVLVSLAMFVVAAGTVGAAMLVPGLMPSAWSTDAVVLGLLAGVAGAIGSWALYAALALGPMSVVSPLTAGLYALVPAVAGFALGDRLPWYGVLALGLVVVATVLLSRSPGERSARVTARALVLSLIAGVSLGAYIVLIDRAPAASGFVPLLVDYLTGIVVFLGAWLLTSRARAGGELRRLGLGSTAGATLLAGLGLALGNILLLIGLRLGELAVMGVLNALYPLGTVLLALIVLRERLHPLQVAGIVLAVAASALLALA